MVRGCYEGLAPGQRGGPRVVVGTSLYRDGGKGAKLELAPALALVASGF